MQLLSLDDIKNRIDIDQIITMQEQGFQAYSAGKVDVPPVGYLQQTDPPGAYHLKYGIIKGDKIWLVKIAGGPKGMPASGMMIAMDTQTGKPQTILQDDGYLTRLRTAVAGLICAKYLAPRRIDAIGVVGTAIQAQMQVEILKHHTACRDVYVYGRTDRKVEAYIDAMGAKGFNVVACDTARAVAQKSNLIITATNAHEGLLGADDIAPGTHVTAMGADSPGKQELRPEIFQKASRIVVDSRPQCIDHGEVCHALNQGLIQEEALLELGEVIADPKKRRQNDTEITIADLTGVAVQDIQIAKAVMAFKR